MLAILVPVLFAFMGFAIDLSRLYLARAELQVAANAAALAAANRLIGTDASAAAAAEQAQFSLDASSGFGNRYDFGGLQIGQSNGFLNSEILSTAFFDTAAAAVGTAGGTGGEVGGAQARYVRFRIRGEAPLVFFAFLPIAQERKIPIETEAVAGLSAPLCTACGIEPIAVPAIDEADTADFGFVAGQKYTFGYLCTGQGAPGGIGDAPRLPYLLLNRYNESQTLYPDEASQAMRIGAQGMLPTAAPDNTSDPAAFGSRACMSIATDESVWLNAQPAACQGSRISAIVSSFLCGLNLRLDAAVTGVCANVPDAEAIAGLYQQDTDINQVDDYAAYTGSGRRVLTVAVVSALNAAAAMQPLGFRQFLLEPDPDATTINPNDVNGRFVALYIGSIVPLRQGRYEGCTITSGPGKVVLHK
jgi:hypothetical protein